MDNIIDALQTQAEELVSILEQGDSNPEALKYANLILRNVQHAKAMLKAIRAQLNVIPSRTDDGTIKLRFNDDPHPLSLEIFISAAQTIYTVVKPLLEDKP